MLLNTIIINIIIIIISLSLSSSLSLFSLSPLSLSLSLKKPEFKRFPGKSKYKLSSQQNTMHACLCARAIYQTFKSLSFSLFPSLSLPSSPALSPSPTFSLSISLSDLPHQVAHGVVLRRSIFLIKVALRTLRREAVLRVWGTPRHLTVKTKDIPIKAVAAYNLVSC